MPFFLVVLLLMFVPAIIHIFVDRSPARRTRPRVLKLFFFWLLGTTGAVSIFEGLGHAGPESLQEELAEQIGFAQSGFQLEVGFGDIAMGVLLLLAVWKRGTYIIPALIALSIMYLGDAIGHIEQWVNHDNTEPGNIYAIPTDILQPVVSIILYLILRRDHPEVLAERTHHRRHAAAQASGRSTAR